MDRIAPVFFYVTTLVISSYGVWYACITLTICICCFQTFVRKTCMQNYAFILASQWKCMCALCEYASKRYDCKHLWLQLWFCNYKFKKRFVGKSRKVLKWCHWGRSQGKWIRPRFHQRKIADNRPDSAGDINTSQVLLFRLTPNCKIFNL